MKTVAKFLIVHDTRKSFVLPPSDRAWPLQQHESNSLCPALGSGTYDHLQLTAVNIKKSPPGKEGFCHEIYAPICGSDGKTYPNDCFFCFEVQKTDNKLKFVHFGKC
ncbi:serine protease inhibitor Kazal-type 9 [Callorhinus ursinus]|uniref:serine protease inhibitor Kazal-type 9 n=1 Tax=Callorhinus ursinus TaxID=34884 RepID=UPI003CD03C2A